jgi:hypothetical protein
MGRAEWTRVRPGVRVLGSPVQAVAREIGGPVAGLAATSAAPIIGPKGLVLEGLDDIRPEPAVRFGWCRHHKTIVSLENS